MATLPNTGMETLPAGTTNVQGIIDANFKILDELVASHKALATATTVQIDAKDGLIQEISINANLTITGLDNSDPGVRVVLVIHTSAARTVTVPVGWIAAGTPVLSTTGAGAIVLQIIPTNGGTVYGTL